MPFVFYLKKITTLLINHYPREDPYFQVQIIYKYLIIKKETKESMLFWRNGSLTFNIIFCQRYYSLRSWRYCLGARLKFWRRSHNPKKGVGDEAFEIPISPGLRHSWRLRHQISLDYYTIPPATLANFKITMWLPLITLWIVFIPVMTSNI